MKELARFSRTLAPRYSNKDLIKVSFKIKLDYFLSHSSENPKTCTVLYIDSNKHGVHIYCKNGKKLMQFFM